MIRRPLRSARLLIAFAVAGLSCSSPLDGTGMTEGTAGTGGSAGAGGRGGASGGGSDAGATDAQPTGTFVPELNPLPDRDTIPGTTPLRRLSLLEYGNTIRDLLAIAAPAPSLRERFVRDIDAGDSGFNRGAPILNGEDALAFLLSGEAIGAEAAQKLSLLLPCLPLPTTDSEQEACAARFITTFGLRAFRRPLLQKESDKLLALYRTLRGPDAADTFEQAIGDLVTAMVNTPELLYHNEQGPTAAIKDGPLVRFSQFELASRLSYLFWASMPDQTLLDAARDGQLDTTERLVRQASRLFADGRARDAVEDFHGQWLEVDRLDEVAKDPALVDFSPQVARSMIEESRAFAASLFFGPQADGKLETLLTGTASFVDAGLAKVYGLPPPMGAGLQPVSLDPGQRAGIFTRAAFLASKADAGESNPSTRGAAILRRLVCLDLLPPADVIVPPPPDPSAGVTTRERFENAHRQMCANGCHLIIDPLGFALENYDGIGAYRTMDRGKTVDARGVIANLLPSGLLIFKNALELMPQLAKTDEVIDCMPTQWLRYLLRRRERPGEMPTLRELARTFRARNGDMRHLLFGVVRSRPFTHRALASGEAP
jgi:hypothetical protein